MTAQTRLPHDRPLTGKRPPVSGGIVSETRRNCSTAQIQLIRAETLSSEYDDLCSDNVQRYSSMRATGNHNIIRTRIPHSNR
ncbi:hypothetical protein V9T40_014471 [Parthenolecanium corni]|uniref:Uncharacterized protein n=1 Tax=Parthenolecanium corni TaxID=536013 RepID=A0AAN9T768_9HEMI